MDHIQQSINTLVERVAQQEAEVNKTKSAVNALRAVLNQPPMYADLDAKRPAMTGTLRGDEFYGLPLSSVVRTILESRKEAGGGAASVNEIFAAMTEGGYAFEATNDDNAKRSLRISLTKNSQTFHKLPNGKYGLREWYPNVKEGKSKAVVQAGITGLSDAVADDDDFPDLETKEMAAEAAT